MPTNHLIIGLGGTGGNIIRSFRKTVYQTYSSDLAPNVNLRYLYVDSSDEFMRPEDPSWKILGHSVQLSQRSQLLIEGVNLKNVIENLNQYPALKPWLGNREDWKDILNSADSAKIFGGQKRRLGRFLFAINASKFREKVMEFVTEMQQDRSRGFAAPAATTFHVCCGLAGGTGSGSVIDAICQIRMAFPDPQQRIILYALLPEHYPAPGRAGPNYHANGYAALVELNALDIGSWRPHNILANDGSRVTLQDPFNCCYLFNDENEANIAVSLPELGDITASFLFQKIVQEENIEWGPEGSSIRRQETYEIGSQARTPERSARGAVRRSRAFFSFGIKQIAYPEVEIQEFLTYSFAVQAVRQMLFDRWVADQGFSDNPVDRNSDIAESVRKPEVMTKWYLTDDRLTLSEGILPAEIMNKSWKPIGEFWKALIPNYVTEVLDSYKHDYVKMLPELTKYCDVAFTEQYRGTGVNNFYETKRRDMTDHIRELRGRIERDLFSSWRNGEKERSIHDIDRLVIALVQSLEERLPVIDSKISKISEESELYKTNEAKIGENRAQWAKLGPISVMVGKHKNILNAQAEALITRYTLRTRLQGFRYARELTQRLIQEFNILSKEIGRCKLLITDAAKHFDTAVDTRLKDGTEKDLSKPMIREYDPDQVRSFVRQLTTDSEEQHRQASAARERLILQLADRITFANFSAKISIASFEDTLSESCRDEAKTAHANVIAMNPERGRLMGVSLIDFLRRQYEGNEDELNRFTRNTMNMAKNYLKLDLGEIKTGPSANDPAQAICTTFVTIVAPKSPESTDFRDHFCNLLRNANPGPLARIVSNDKRPHEITIVSITSVFPARFVAVAVYLKEKYEARRSGANPRRAFLEIHSEGEGYALGPGQELYDLYSETYKPADILPWINLAQALGVITEGKDQTGRKLLQLQIRRKSESEPEKPPFALGTDFDSVVQNAAPATVEELKDQIQNILTTDFLRIEKREELAKTILDRLAATGASLGTDTPRYRQEFAAYETIRGILELEN